MRFPQCCVVLGLLVAPGVASAQIKEPGNHPLYRAEVEPHLIVQWNDYDIPCSNNGFGPGVRVDIPFLDNGPVPRINNNMAIGFGLDWAHYGRRNCYNFYNSGSANVFSAPVVVQWNFFLLRQLNVFGEAGLLIQYRDYDGFSCVNGYCPGSGADVDPSFSVGGRFMVSDSIGFLLRLGYPYFSAGASILL